MKHSFITTKPQGSDNSVIGPNQWNDTHLYDVRPIAADTTLTFDMDILSVTAGSGGVTLTLPTASGNKGRTFVVKKVDSAVGSVTVGTSNSQTVDGNLFGYVLINQWQYVEICSDGVNWLVIRNN